MPMLVADHGRIGSLTGATAAKPVDGAKVAANR